MSRCIGCGAKIQSHNPNVVGYVPEIAMIEKGENVYCQRCYGIKHHNLKYIPENNLKDYYEKIRVIKDEKALVILIIDVMDITGGFIEKINEYIGTNKVLIIVNKVDVIPKAMKIIFMEEYVRKYAKMKKINIEGILFGSLKNTKFVEQIVNKINKLKYPRRTSKFQKVESRFDNCYVIGHASVGKSTFMNQLGKMYLNFESDVITTSNQFQTTVDFIKWPLDKNSFIIDTPGIINPKHFGAYLDYESVNILTPKKYIKPRTYQLNPDQTIFLGGLVQLDFFGNSKINVSFYVSNDLYIHRTKTVQALNIKNTQKFKMLIPPVTEEEAKRIDKTVTKVYNINEPTNIFISGIGFIHIVSTDAKISVTLPQMINIQVLKEGNSE